MSWNYCQKPHVDRVKYGPVGKVLRLDIGRDGKGIGFRCQRKRSVRKNRQEKGPEGACDATKR